MVVTFTVYVPAKSQVVFGESESALNSLVTGPVTRFVDKGQRVHYIHRVTLKNLKPRTTYCASRVVDLQNRFIIIT